MNKIKERENGYYWIQRGNHTIDPVTEDGWEVGYYDTKEGWFSIWGGAYKDSELIEINESKLELPEKKEISFDWDYFYNYIITYSPKEHAGNDPQIILRDILYGLGVATNKSEYRWGNGYKKFKEWLIMFLKI